ncbi:hypothetical protein F4780DRAFT_734096 [Xylariomycetidae sp. FL0641]|nr:hypothetical protein F4780DRAFT_734096 [Xylariomycetidae sp. FL0641]
MRPTVLNGRFLARCRTLQYRYRCFSAQAAASGRLTVAAPAQTSKKSVIESLARYAGSSSTAPDVSGHEGTEAGAAILASHAFTNWLDDEVFMSNILKQLFQSTEKGQHSPNHIDLLVGVTDGLSPRQLLGEPQQGFSVIYGSTTNILPDLWKKNEVQAVSEETAASVSFVTNPLAGDSRPLEITLPLANTVFQNGRRSTLLASRWQKSPEGSWGLTRVDPTPMQKIAPGGFSVDHASPSVPLIPLTPPRKIVAGLGNIVRQVEVDGTATPASKELEALIPRVFEARDKQQDEPSMGPIGVWCWVIPPHVVKTKNLLSLPIFQPESARPEAELAAEVMNTFSELIPAGCRLHKILGGGGGWGLKQGLLSLDPQRSYSVPEQDDVEMFIKSFQERDSGDSSDGVVTPGSYIMYCIEPQWTDKDISASRSLASTAGLAVGVAPSIEPESSSASATGDVEVMGDHFGACSAGGIFLRTIPDVASIGQQDDAAVASRAFTTKIDVPGACVSVSRA